MTARAASRRSTVVVAVVVAAYFVAGTIVSAQLGTWTDEEYTLATTAHGMRYAFERALAYELQAPLYFVLEAAWRTLDPSVWWARMTSVCCATALFLAFVLIGRRIAPHRTPLASAAFAALAALNPYVVYAAFEIRLYALALLFGAAMWLLFDRGFVTVRDTRARVAFVVVSVAALYTQYFLGFALIGYGAVLLVRGDRRALVAFACACVPIALAALPLLAWAHAQVSGYVTQQPTVSFIVRHAAVHPWLEFVFPYDRDWDVARGVRPVYDAIVAVAFAAVLAVRPRLDRAGAALVAGAAAIQLTYLALICALGLALDDRHFVALYVPLAAATYAVLDRALANGRAVTLVVVALMTALTCSVLATKYRNLAQPGDWRRVGAYLTAAVKPDDAVVVYAADAAPALARTYRGSAPIVPFPATPSANAYDEDRLVVHSQAQATAALLALGRRRRLWFVTDVRCRPDEGSYGCANVAPAIDRSYAILGERDFYENRVLELERKT